jgi:molybdate transport system permease protein
VSHWQPLLLSLEVALVATALATCAGIALALLLTWRRLVGRDLLDAISSAPMVMPPTVLGYYLLVALGRHSAIGRAFEAVTGSSIVFTRTGAVVAATLGALPLVIKSARAALEGVDPTLLKAARTLGARPARAFFTVHLPLAAPGLVAGVMLAFARSLGDFGVTLMVAGDIPGQTQTAALAIYDLIQSGEERAAAGLVAVLTSVTIVALYLVNKLTPRRPHE